MTGAQTRLEDNLFRSYWDDGILDLVCGIALIFVCVTWFFGAAYLIGGSLVPLVYLWFALRRWIVEPRAGFVEFSRRRKSGNLRGLAIAMSDTRVRDKVQKRILRLLRYWHAQR